MGITRIGVGYPTWREIGKTQRNNLGADFTDRIAGMVSRNGSESSRKKNVISGRDNYVGGNAPDIYGMGVYSRKDLTVPREVNLAIGTEKDKNGDAPHVKGGTSGYQAWLSQRHNANLFDAGTGPLSFRKEKMVPDRELNPAGSQEPGTKTEIIVKPDGSRVLVMTMSIGGMEATMSMEISKPTQMPNGYSGQDASHMPTAEKDAASDGTPNMDTGI